MIQVLLVNALDIFFYVIRLLILGRILLSWVVRGYNNPLTQMIYSLTEPILGPCRRMLDKSPLGGGMMLDFSPIVALILLSLVHQLLLGLVVMI